MVSSKRRLEFTLDAIDETRDARAWYGLRSTKAEMAFLAELRGALRNIRESPETWPRFDHGTRRFVLNRFPFSVIYRISESAIQVIALAHDKKRPGYWRFRS